MASRLALWVTSEPTHILPPDLPAGRSHAERVRFVFQHLLAEARLFASSPSLVHSPGFRLIGVS